MTVIMDPFKSEMVGLPFAKEVADIVTVSHGHDDHNALENITGPVTRQDTFVIDKEGEYEIGGVEIAATKMYHDKVEGAERGKNLIVNVRMDGLNILHLGDLGHKLSEAQIEKIGSVDVLMVGVGGVTALETNEVMDLIKDIQPSYVIPMHYKVAGMTEAWSEKHTLEEFLDKNKFLVAGEPVHKIKVDEGSLPDDTQVLIMNA
ncbi:MAG: Zn-dependent hydrolase of the beta-lactamase fold-like protein [Candidatus Collierbacteria bacterium GW2011_GWD2_42_50]|nr:MAG: Zn-dependent hydrolase of the beta-lactamase fold-like protein [Candidatus Collierbacteria bacterium GW2011_GWD2_42_50]KKS62801.1 MAG: Zn-dependent hydrolase of the beta-lactamase fold-like protein [Candidatus Collierbacteria bacterium GW2011_GWF1_42_50]KKS64795.1 MAG: Zn-dependent hydrolase of the beta-lactamase fold-like protein [Candidatus Collierbacteria bacterium GW2011_GWF2_42_51]